MTSVSVPAHTALVTAVSFLTYVASSYVASLVVMQSGVAQEVAPAVLQRTEVVSFENEILPILQKNCLACHSASEKQGALNLETPEAIRKGGDTGPAAIPGNGGESLLIRLASGRDEPSMPPADNDVRAERLSPEELGLIQLWINQGALGTGSVNLMSPKRWGAVPRSVEPVQAIALSADGQQVAFSRGTQLLVYHVPSGTQLAQLTDPAVAEPRDLIQSLAMNAEGNLLVSGSFREIKVWRRPSDVQTKSFALGTAGQVVVVSPDGRLMAVAGADFVIRLWRNVSETLSETPPVLLSGHTAAISAMEFTADGKQLVSSSLDHSIRIWDTADAILTETIQTAGPVTALEIVTLPNKQKNAADTELRAQGILASGGAEGSIRLWDWPRSRPVIRHTTAVEKLAVSADNRWRAAVGADGRVRITKLSELSETPITEVSPPLADWKVVAAAISSGDAPMLLLGLADGHLELWDVQKQLRVVRWRGGTTSIPQVSIASNGQMAATVVDETGRLHLWDLKSETVAQADGALDQLEGIRIKAISTSVNQEWLAWAGEDFRVRVRQTSQPEPGSARVVELPEVIVTAVGLSDDGTELLVGSADGRLRILSVGDGSVMKEYVIGEQSVKACGFLNGQVWSVEHDQTLRFRNRDEGSILREIGLPFVPTAAAFSGDGQRLAVAADGQTVRVLRADSGSEEKVIPMMETSPRTLSFSMNGEQLLITDRSGQCSSWDVTLAALRESSSEGVSASWISKDQQVMGIEADGGIRRIAQRYRHRLDPAAGTVTAVRFLNKDQTVVVATDQGALLGYVVGEGRNHFRSNHDGGIKAISVASDDQTIASGGVNGTIRLWQSNGNPAGIQEIRGLSAGMSELCFADNNSRVVAAYGGENPEIAVYEAATGTLQQKITQANIAEQDTLLGLIPSVLGDILIERRESQQRIRPVLRRVLTGHSQSVTALANDSAREDRLYSGSQDGVLRRWNLESGQSEQQYNHGSGITAIAIRPDGQRLATGSDSNIRLWNVNGQQIQEMRGDVRCKAEVITAQQELNAARSRVNVAKQQLEAAEKEVPVRLEAEKKQNEAVAAAEKDLADKKQALEKAETEKADAEKAAVEASMMARQLLREKELADLAVVEATAIVRQTQMRLSRLQQLLNASPTNEGLQQRVTAMQAELTASQEKQQLATAAVELPTQKSQELSKTANEAATKVSALLKPWLDATDATKTAQATLSLAQTQQKLTVAEREVAERLVPAKKDVLNSAEETVKLAETELEAANQRVQQSNQAIRTCRFSPSGKVLVTAGDFGRLHSWDSETGVALDAYAGHTGPVRELCFLNDQQVVSAGDDQTARIWELNPAWKLERTIGSVDDPSFIVHRVTALDLSRDSQLILAGGGVPSRTGEIQVIRVTDGTRVFHQPEAHTDVIYAARFSPDDSRIATGGADRFVRILRSDTGEVMRRLEGHTNYVTGVAWKGNGQALVTSSSDQTIKVWEVENGDQQRTIENFGRPITGISFLGETDNIVSACGDQMVRMHNSANGGLIRNFPGAGAWLQGVAATPDSGFVAAGDVQGKVRIWNGNNGQLVRTLP